MRGVVQGQRVGCAGGQRGLHVGIVAQGEEGEQQLSLQAEHLALLLGGHVVIAEQVQDAVDGEQ